MTTAFVLSGGGNLGAIQVGMLQALYERGVRPDLIVGTSVGAINGTWLAGRGANADLDQLEATWCSLRRSDIFPLEVFGGFRGFVGQRGHVVPDRALRRLLHRELRIDRLEQAPIPIHVVATDIKSGRDVLLGSGHAVDAVCASAAIPGVLPPVEIDGRLLVDGGVVNNCPISHAVALGATRIWVLPCGYACSLERPPRGAVATILQSITLLVQQRLHLDVEKYQGTLDLHVVPCLCPVRIPPTDFSQAASLIEASAQSDAPRGWAIPDPSPETRSLSTITPETTATPEGISPLPRPRRARRPTL